MNNSIDPVLLALLFLAGMLSATFFGAVDMEGNYQTQAIERGYALHCPDTGDFAWKGECNDLSND